MKTNRLLILTPLLALAAMLFALGGCDSDPTEPDTSGAPTLPDAQQMQIDLTFFDQAQQREKSGEKIGDNFFNAYLRVVVLNLMLRYYLTPPVAAFALAVHTVPSPQDDGSWIWVYTHVDGEEELQIRLRGMPSGDNVLWELRVSASSTDPAIENELWFSGETRNEGQFGTWTFYDFTLEGDPAVSTIEWGEGLDGNYLIITALYGEDAGDVLTFTHAAPECSIDFLDADTEQSWYIRWNEETGTGSLMVPDYNEGLPACWDENQDDTPCDDRT
jgi:hypothetical protein